MGLERDLFLGLVSIHAPRVGSDLILRDSTEYYRKFQSTLPVWGATVFRLTQIRHPARFNPRSPCGERPEMDGMLSTISSVSIHAPRVGSDAALKRLAAVRNSFNPRSPCGERPSRTVVVPVMILCFNPRSPCGERLLPGVAARIAGLFQSTLPVWGATESLMQVTGVDDVSIHAPRVGSDVVKWTKF